MHGTKDETVSLAGHLGTALILLGMVATSITVVLRRSAGRPQVLAVAAIVSAVLFTGASQLLCLAIICREPWPEGEAREQALCPVEQTWAIAEPRRHAAAR